MASSTPVCGICDLRHINKPSAVWCSECEEGLCVDCKEHHGLSRGTRKHNTIPITQYMSLPKNILEIREYCDEHKEKFQLFCKQHDCPCCRLCAVESHSKCDGVMAIERVIQNIKISDTFQETEHLIAEILETIDKMRTNRTANISSVQHQRETVEKEILAARTKINKHLDRIQETLFKELDEVETNIEIKTTDVLTSLKAKEQELNEYQTTMSSIKQYATDLQTFVSLNEIERSISSIDKSVQTLLETETMNDVVLSFKLDKVMEEFPTNVSTFGKVIVQTKPNKITISRRKHKQAQIMAVPTPSKSIENITLKLEQTIKTKMKDTRGCVLLPDGRMVFSCFDRIQLINKDGTESFITGKFSITAFDVAFIEGTNTIAVTSGFYWLGYIRIIDMGSGQIKKTIPVKSACYGIVYRNNTLVYCVPHKGLRMINLTDDTISDVFEGSMSLLSYVATYQDKLYYTNYDKNTVTCCDLHGNTRWQFHDESALKRPLGVAVDNDGNVYVVGEGSHNVVVIFSDGQRYRKLLRPEDGMNNPKVLHYDRSTNRLLVAKGCDFFRVFNIKR